MVEWSPDGKKLAFCLTLENGIELWMLDVGSRQADRLTGPYVNDAMRGSPYQWHPNSNSIIYKSIDRNRISPPKPSAIPMGPVVQENTGGKAPVRTYQNLLKNPHDEKVFEYYTSYQLV